MKNRTKLVVLGIVVLALMALAAADGLPWTQPSVADAGGHKVLICHFDGHEGGTRNRHDFVLTGAGGACNNQGGQILSVSRQACKNGHKAEPRQSGGPTCDTAN